MIVVQRAAALSLAVVTLVAGLIGTPAQAVNVTVGGTTYNVEFFAGGESYDNNTATLSSPATAPWLGSLAQATAFANAYRSQVSTPYPFEDTPGFTDYIFFSYSPPGGIVDLVFLRDDGVVNNVNLAPNTADPTYHYAYTTPFSAVPEIDGNALAQAALILLALFLVLRGRRQGMV